MDPAYFPEQQLVLKPKPILAMCSLHFLLKHPSPDQSASTEPPNEPVSLALQGATKWLSDIPGLVKRAVGLATFRQRVARRASK